MLTFIPKLIFKRNGLLAVVFLWFSISVFSQTVTITAPIASASYCAGTNITVNYTVTSNFGTGNVFTTQLSDAAGSFASPVTLGTRTAINSGGSTFLIPYTTPSSSLYRVRVITSNPTFTSQSNGVDLAISGLAISTPTLPNYFFCQGETFSCTYNQSCNFATGNTYSVQLSDASGSFASPLTIGTRTGTTAAAITCTIPISAVGPGYRIRIVGSNPSVTSPDNGYNILINASAGTPSVAGNGFWNAYCFNLPNNYASNYQGFFTENNMSFDTRARYTSTLSPSTTSLSAAGNAYAGCTFTNSNNYSVSLKRTNIPCGYYDFSIVGHDDAGSILIDGITVYSNPYIGGVAVPNAYRGFISPTNTVEVRYSNTGSGPGYMAINITTVNVLNMSPPITICAGTSGTVSATNSTTVGLNTYSWSPVASLTVSTTGTNVPVSPNATTIYTVNTVEPVTGCPVSNTIQVTVNPVATTTVASTSTVMCSGITQVTLTAGGAASYTWSPAAGLSSVNGPTVSANPTVNTTYTVSGSNNCNTVNASTTIVVQAIPASPTPTTYGASAWNVYCYNDQTFTNYYGYYTENNLNFATSSRWNASNAPSSCTTTSTGLPYSGCDIIPTSWSMRFRRTNIPCGYYQIDIPSKDDNLKLYIDGVLVASAGCCAAQTNFWTGFIGPSTLVEFTLVNTGGPGNMGASFISVPYPITGPPITICAGGPATITATPFISGASYNWGPAIALSPATGTAVVISPTANIVYTVTVSDPVTTCSASATQTVNVNPLPTTTVSPTNTTIACAAQTPTLNAGGAYTYSWSPAAGLSSTTGYSVVATPTVTTVYTVTGSNVCANVNATTTITVIPLATPAVFPANAWNVYCHNNTTFSNYYGYYTHTGSGTTGYDFNTATQWASGIAPSTATANASGTAYMGCVMSPTNISLSFKRTNFACGTYSILCISNDDGVALLIDGVQVAARGAAATTSVVMWSGVLSSSSQVEFKLNQGGGGSGLNIRFVAAAATASLSTWVGGTNTDWFTASNWCGSGVPTPSTDVFIPNSKPQFMPVINGAGAACRSLTISASTPSNSVSSALPQASLAINGANSVDVYGNWINNGYFDGGSGTVNMLGVSSTSVSGSSTETFYNLVINKTGTATVSIPSGVHQVAGDMNFSGGIVNQSATLRFLNNATTSGANNNSYVNGQVIKVGTQAFTFPVGANSFYRPVSISAPAVATDHFTAQYFNIDPSPPYTYSSKDATIDHIGRCEYWILNRTGGSSNVSVTLTWNTTSCGVTNLSDLLVARWDAGQARWKDEGNGGTTGNFTTGSIITSAPVTLFSPFTLASRTSQNPLPIELVNFNCDLNDRNVTLSWTTASELHNDYFSIERSADGVSFETIGTQKGAGNSSSVLNYSFKDDNALKGINYYRLKQVDYTGTFKYSSICTVTNNNTKGNIAFYPNPVRSLLTVDFNASDVPLSTILFITDVTGKIIKLPLNTSGSKAVIDCSSLEDGIYFIKVVSGNKEIVNKFTIQR